MKWPNLINKQFILLVILLWIGFGGMSLAGDPLTLAAGLVELKTKNPALAGKRAGVEASQALLSKAYAPDKPTLGYFELSRNTTTRYLSFGQKIDFPNKYLVRGQLQKRGIKAKEHELGELTLKLRSIFIATYYQLHGVQRIIELTRAELERLRDVSRIAESRYAAGQGAQYESMRGHVAQTETEAELLRLADERTRLQAALIEILGREAETWPNLPTGELPVPVVKPSLNQIKMSDVSGSPYLLTKEADLSRAASRKSLADWDYAPDFMVKYQHRIDGLPDASHILSLEMDVPLWFWGQRSASRSARAAQKQAALARDSSRSQLQKRLTALKSEVSSRAKLVQIFQTSLVPQALSTYRITDSAYRANKANFFDLLESERSWLQVQADYYRQLADYVQAITQLETVLGRSLSDLPLG